MKAWIGLLRLSRRSQPLERTEGESELSHLARVAAANLGLSLKRKKGFPDFKDDDILALLDEMQHETGSGIQFLKEQAQNQVRTTVIRR